METASVIFPLLGKTLPSPLSTHNATVLDTGDLTCSKTCSSDWWEMHWARIDAHILLTPGERFMSGHVCALYTDNGAWV